MSHFEPPPSRGQPVCAAVAATVAGAEDTDVAVLSPPLYETINTDALNELIATADSTTHVTFTYHSYEITVRGDRHIAVDEHRE